MTDAHAVLTHSWRTARRRDLETTASAEDLTKAFDSISPAQAVAIIHHCGMPKDVASVIGSFYQQNKTVFAMEKYAAPEWCSRGLHHGCPFSRLLKAAAMMLWSALYHQLCPETRLLIFYDDRLMWFHHTKQQQEHATTVVQRSLLASSTVDKIFALEANLGRGQVASSSADTCRALDAANLGTPRASRYVDYLGLHYDLATADIQLMREDDAVVCARDRLSRIGAVASTLEERCILIKQLVHPLILWAAGFTTTLGLTVLDKEIRNSITGRLPKGACLTIVRQTLVEDCDLEMACHLRTFRRLMTDARRQVSCNAWLDAAPLNFTSAPPEDRIPDMANSLKYFDWTLTTEDGHTELKRSGPAGLAKCRIGWNGFGVIANWVRAEFRTRWAVTARRLVHDCHRKNATADTARGLRLPNPPPPFVFGFAAHAQAIGAELPIGPASRAVGLGTGLRKWYVCQKLPKHRRDNMDDPCYKIPLRATGPKHASSHVGMPSHVSPQTSHSATHEQG